MMKKENSSTPAKSRLHKIVSRMISVPTFAATIVLTLLMLTAELNHIVRPSTWTIPSYLGLVFPIMTTMMALFSVYWLIKRKWKVLLLPALTFVICHNDVGRTFALHGKGEDDGTKTLKVMSYNVRLFNFFDQHTKILKMIKESESDIVCIQEFGFYNGNLDIFLTRQKLCESMKKKYKYMSIFTGKTRLDGAFGTAIFSKYPIKSEGEIAINGETHDAMYVDISFEGETIRIYNLHLASNKLTSDDKKAVQDFLTQSQNNTLIVNEIKNKLSDAYKKREAQVDSIVKRIEKADMPTIICGDFNDVPVSYAYSTLCSKGFSDCFSERGNGYANTYKENMFWFRIDHILHDWHFSATEYEKIKHDESDHYPVCAKLKLKKPDTNKEN